MSLNNNLKITFKLSLVLRIIFQVKLEYGFSIVKFHFRSHVKYILQVMFKDLEWEYHVSTLEESHIKEAPTVK